MKEKILRAMISRGLQIADRGIDKVHLIESQRSKYLAMLTLNKGDKVIRIYYDNNQMKFGNVYTFKHMVNNSDIKVEEDYETWSVYRFIPLKWLERKSHHPEWW